MMYTPRNRWNCLKWLSHRLLKCWLDSFFTWRSIMLAILASSRSLVHCIVFLILFFPVIWALISWGRSSYLLNMTFVTLCSLLDRFAHIFLHVVNIWLYFSWLLNHPYWTLLAIQFRPEGIPVILLGPLLLLVILVVLPIAAHLENL